jgi:hypothetical protein
MRPAGATLLAALLAGDAVGIAAVAGAPDPTPVAAASRPFALVEELAVADAGRRGRAAERLLAMRDPSLLPPLVDQLFFVPVRHRAEIERVLAGLTGTTRERHLDWVGYLGEHPELVAPPGYLGWKGRLLARIDPRFGELLRDGQPVRLRPEEVVFGGVRFDGIPALEWPAHRPAKGAPLADGELVFAAEVAGEARAWPLAVLSWHEMLNDRLGGEPVTLSFCTLCRSAVLYRGRLPDGRESSFGTSGLLYRSNKLMYDRLTRTLWSNLTGEPVLGPLAAAPRPLDVLPMVLSTWGAWRRRHPQTTVMVGDAEVARRHGYDYRAGAADARRAGVSFPAPGRDARLAPQDEVLGLRLAGEAKAWELRGLLAAGVLVDTLGGEPLVLLADAESGAVRAYRRPAGRSFRRDPGGELVDDTGARWRVEEGALVPHAGSGAPQARLPLLPSYWFGWTAFYPGSALWTGGAG